MKLQIDKELKITIEGLHYFIGGMPIIFNENGNLFIETSDDFLIDLIKGHV